MTTQPIRWPEPLTRGSRIGITAPSSGVKGAALRRLDLVLDHLRAQHYEVVEGQCLRDDLQHVSAPAPQRAAELMAFLRRDDLAAVIPPWGGELAIELLERLDFEALRQSRPRWFMGYSDLSTLALPLTLLSGWATAHGPCLMDLAPTQTDPLTTGALALLSWDGRQPIVQQASRLHQVRWTRFEDRFDAPLNLTDPTRWKRLDGQTGPLTFSGVLIGGCLDTLAWLAGTRYADVPGFVQRHAAQGTVLYLENVEMSPVGLVRCLTSLRLQGWFDGLSGLLLGRSAAPVPESAEALGYEAALQAALGGVECPVLWDVDIGHRPPQFTLINGAWARVHFEDQSGWVEQRRLV